MPDIRPIHSLKFEGLTYAHDGGTELFSDVTFEFPMNSVTAVNGLSGCGRSSLLMLLAGLSEPQHGSYYINDENVTEMSFEEFLGLRLNIGYSFDLGGLIVNRSLEENLLLPLRYHQVLSEKEARERVEYYLVSMGIYDQRNERPAHVSGGTRKTCCILRSMILKPQVLLMDDPTVGLSRDGTQLLVAFIEKLMGEGAVRHVFITSHDDRFLSCFNHKIINISKKSLALKSDEDEKKVANL